MKQINSKLNMRRQKTCFSAHTLASSPLKPMFRDEIELHWLQYDGNGCNKPVNMARRDPLGADARAIDRISAMTLQHLGAAEYERPAPSKVSANLLPFTPCVLAKPVRISRQTPSSFSVLTSVTSSNFRYLTPDGCSHKSALLSTRPHCSAASLRPYHNDPCVTDRLRSVADSRFSSFLLPTMAPSTLIISSISSRLLSSTPAGRSFPAALPHNWRAQCTGNRNSSLGIEPLASDKRTAFATVDLDKETHSNCAKVWCLNCALHGCHGRRAISCVTKGSRKCVQRHCTCKTLLRPSQNPSASFSINHRFKPVLPQVPPQPSTSRLSLIPHALVPLFPVLLSSFTFYPFRPILCSHYHSQLFLPLLFLKNTAHLTH